MKKSKGTVIFILFLAALMLFCFAAGMIVGETQHESDEMILTRLMQEYGVLDGSTLKGVLNLYQLSPGAGIGFAEKYPKYAYLFDPDYIQFVRDH